MSDPYVRHGCPNRWGAQTHPMGYRSDLAKQFAREAIARLGDLLTPASVEWSAPPPQRLEQARARARG